MPCDATPTAADWAAARSRIRDDVLVLRTERFDESAALLDAVAGDAGAPRLRDLARLRYRCAADNRRDGDPGRRCAATAGVAVVDPRDVFPEGLVPALEAALAADAALEPHLVAVFEHRLRQFGIT